jgi:Helix-turn-helix domain
MTMSTVDEVLSINDVAAILKRHPKTIARYLNQKLIEGTKVRNRWYIRRSAVEALLRGEPADVDESP